VDTPFARNVALSPDKDQQFLYIGNGDDIVIVDRRTLTILGSIKPSGLRNGGHQIATDSKGNIYVAQTTMGLQKLTFTGIVPFGREFREIVK
jgi:DNA-binding beta-propeller fold protein YncE